MQLEEKIRDDFRQQFPFLEGNISITRPRRISIKVAYANFREVLEFAMTREGLDHLCTITGVDSGENLCFIYHLSRENGLVLNLETCLSKEKPVLETVIPYFPDAEIYERELVDLFGAQVHGLPSGNRYPLTDDWPRGEYPLRKDWRPKQEKPGKEEFKNA